MRYAITLTIRGNAKEIEKLREFVAGESLPAKTTNGFDLDPLPLPFCFHNIIPVRPYLDSRYSERVWMRNNWDCERPPDNIYLIHATAIELKYQYETMDGMGQLVLEALSKRFQRLLFYVHYDSDNLMSGDFVYRNGKRIMSERYVGTLCHDCGYSPDICICSTVVENVQPKPKPTKQGRRVTFINKK